MDYLLLKGKHYESVAHYANACVQIQYFEMESGW